MAARIHALNRRLKDGLAGMSHVTLLTPRADALSAGIVVFSVDRLSPARGRGGPGAAADRRHDDALQPVARAAGAGAAQHPGEVDRVLAAVRALR